MTTLHDPRTKRPFPTQVLHEGDPLPSKRTYIDIHVIQTVPPSNLNRDDAGSPKQAMFGGVRRARVSSQAWKRATRMHFVERTPPAAQATRTARISALLRDGLVARTDLDAAQADRVTSALLAPLEIKGGKKKENTAYLLFFGRAQLDRIIEQAAARLGAGTTELSDKALAAVLTDISVRAELGVGHPIDVALFGRMVADLPDLNVDAAVQVAHAISTHAVETEFDYFTAVDDEKDLSLGDDAGAAMIGTIEFNSATLYRYATVCLHELIHNVGGATDDAVDAVRRFVDGFIRSMPTGHQSSFAHRTLPDAVVVVVRDDQPVNLVSAFERPVRPKRSEGGYAAASLVALASAAAEVGERWGGEPRLVGATYAAPVSEGDQAIVSRAFGDSVPFDHLLAVTVAAAKDRIAEAAS